MNDDMACAAGAPEEPELRRQELADCLSILNDVDRHLTHEHVAARFQELLGHVGGNTTPDSRDSLDGTAMPRVNITLLASRGLPARQLKPRKPIRHFPAIPPVAGERDLSAALSGETTDIPRSWLPIADTFAALRTAKATRAHSLAQKPGLSRRRWMRRLRARTSVLMGAATAVTLVLAVLFSHGLLQSSAQQGTACAFPAPGQVFKSFNTSANITIASSASSQHDAFRRIIEKLQTSSNPCLDRQRDLMVVMVTMRTLD